MNVPVLRKVPRSNFLCIRHEIFPLATLSVFAVFCNYYHKLIKSASKNETLSKKCTLSSAMRETILYKMHRNPRI